MLGQSGLWMAQWNLAYDLSEVDPASPIFVQSGRQMAVDQGLRPAFRSLALVAAFASLLEFLVAIELACCLDRAVPYFRLLGGTDERTVEPPRKQSRHEAYSGGTF